MQKEYLFYDLETFGLDAAYDRIAQFACRRYNSQLEPLDEGIVLYCKAPRDYLPSPYSCMVTGITPDFVNKNGISEAEFANRIYAIFKKNEFNTLIVGYNNTHFDDKMLEFLFFRNFLSPYSVFIDRSIDCYTLAKAVYFASPNIFKYRKNDEGLDSLKLEYLTAENGFVHSSAHDALSDVEATAQVFDHIRKNAPDVFEKYLSSFTRSSIEHQLRFAINSSSPVFTLARYGNMDNINGTLSYPLACYYSTFYLFNLLSNEEDFKKNLDGLASLQESMQKDYKDLSLLYPYTQRIKLSASPFLANQEFFYAAKAASSQKIEGLVAERIDKLRKCWKLPFINASASKQKVSKAQSANSNVSEAIAEKDVDETINDGFLDKEAPDVITSIKTDDISIMLGTLNRLLKDPNAKKARIKKLFTRFLARNYYDKLPDNFKSQWDEYCVSRLLNSAEQTGFYKYRTQKMFDEELSECALQFKGDEKKEKLLSSLKLYSDSLCKSK